jgi:hypothetical protein
MFGEGSAFVMLKEKLLLFIFYFQYGSPEIAF